MECKMRGARWFFLPRVDILIDEGFKRGLSNRTSTLPTTYGRWTSFLHQPDCLRAAFESSLHSAISSSPRLCRGGEGSPRHSRVDMIHTDHNLTIPYPSHALPPAISQRSPAMTACRSASHLPAHQLRIPPAFRIAKS